MYLVVLSPRGREITTVIFSGGSETSPTTITWNDIRQICTGKKNGTMVQVSPTLSVKCVR